LKNENGSSSRGVTPAARALKPGLDGRQPAKKPPGQAGVVGEDDALSLGNHGGYIANRPAGYNKAIQDGTPDSPA
jgi:hypothetical protein